MTLGNPYRIRKPKKDILWKGSFRPSTEKGKFTGQGLIKFNAVITSDYLWISSELSIPLQTIQKIDLLNKEGALSIIYHNALSGHDEVIFLCMLDFFGFYHRKKVREFRKILQQTISNLPKKEPNDPVQTFSEKPNLDAGCEKCGETDAALVQLGTFYCIGVYPIFGAYSWQPKRRYLCQAHAVQACMQCNLSTALLGYLGFPGIIVAPIRVWKNISAIKEVFSISQGTVIGELIMGISLPIILVSCLLYSIW